MSDDIDTMGRYALERHARALRNRVAELERHSSSMRRTRLASSGGDLLEAASEVIDVFCRGYAKESLPPSAHAVLERLNRAVNLALALKDCEICGCVYETDADHLEEARGMLAGAAVELDRFRMREPMVVEKYRVLEGEFWKMVEHFKVVQVEFLGPQTVAALNAAREARERNASG